LCKQGEKEYTVDDETLEMIEAPVMEDGIMYVAIRPFSEALGLDIGWNEEERAVIWTAKVSEGTEIKLEAK
jgi:Copper amine oxidase N-terminal domain